MMTVLLWLEHWLVKEIMEKKRRELEAKQKKMEEIAQKRAEMMQRRRDEQRRWDTQTLYRHLHLLLVIIRTMWYSVGSVTCVLLLCCCHSYNVIFSWQCDLCAVTRISLSLLLVIAALLIEQWTVWFNEVAILPAQSEWDSSRSVKEMLPFSAIFPPYGSYLEKPIGSSRKFCPTCLWTRKSPLNSRGHLVSGLDQFGVSRLGLSHWDPYTMHRGSCLELYYCNIV